MVQKAMLYIDDTPDLETRIELIKTLNSVSAGKVNDIFKLDFKAAILMCHICNILYMDSEAIFLFLF